MLATKVEVTGDLAGAIDRLREAGANVNPDLSKAVRVSAFNVQAKAWEMVPISTGMLRNSIKPTIFNGGLSAIIGSFLPYAARQEYDETLNHSVRAPRLRVKNTKAGRPGSVIKGTGQSNPQATWGFLRKALELERENFLSNIQIILNRFSEI